MYQNYPLALSITVNMINAEGKKTTEHFNNNLRAETMTRQQKKCNKLNKYIYL